MQSFLKYQQCSSYMLTQTFVAQVCLEHEEERKSISTHAKAFFRLNVTQPKKFIIMKQVQINTNIALFVFFTQCGERF